MTKKNNPRDDCQKIKNEKPIENDISDPAIQSREKEIANSITHGIGAALSIAGLSVLVSLASRYGDTLRVVSLSIYGATLILLYLSSTLYHSFSRGRVKHFFRFLDHSSIYLLIAGSYTPIVLVSLRGILGWTVFAIVWAMAIGGIIAKIFIPGRAGIFSVVFYIAMGWIVVLAIKPILETVPLNLFIWLLIGGLSYTFGIIFYAMEKMPYNHTIWHLFVLGGSITHFFGMFFYIAIIPT
jgi:hemolysin III